LGLSSAGDLNCIRVHGRPLSLEAEIEPLCFGIILGDRLVGRRIDEELTGAGGGGKPRRDRQG
jgi:hypothetical protein